MNQSPPLSLHSPTDTFDATEREIQKTICPTIVPQLRTFNQQDNAENLTLMSEEITSRIHSKLAAKFHAFKQKGELHAFLPLVEDSLLFFW